MTDTIQIPVDAEALWAYHSASPEERKKIQELLNLWLKGLDRAQTWSLSQVMEEIGKKAKERGLTEDILDDLLRDE